jgi:serine/threonine protein kinase
VLPYLRILNVLGASAHACVYLAEWLPPGGGLVAVKRLHPGVCPELSGADGRSRLLELDHPRIATLYDSGIDADGRAYTVTEFVPGTPLVEFCRRHDLATAVRLELLLQVSEALEYAHARGVEHLNLKPPNVLVEPSLSVKLLDFRASLPTAGSGWPDLPQLCSIVAGVLAESRPRRYESLRDLSSDLGAALAHIA